MQEFLAFDLLQSLCIAGRKTRQGAGRAKPNNEDELQEEVFVGFVAPQIRGISFKESVDGKSGGRQKSRGDLSKSKS